MSIFSVTTAATELSLLSIEELRAAAGVNGPAKDAELLALGRSASTALARQCCLRDDGVNHPTLLRETCTEVFRWTGCGPIRLSRRPVTSVTSVTIDGVAVDATGYEIVDGRNLYRLSSDALTYWASGKITVVYVAGYAPAPYDLKMAATKLFTALNAEKARDPNLKKEEIPGVRTVEFWVSPSDDPLLSKEISDLISPYREMWI